MIDGLIDESSSGVTNRLFSHNLISSDQREVSTVRVSFALALDANNRSVSLDFDSRRSVAYELSMSSTVSSKY